MTEARFTLNVRALAVKHGYKDMNDLAQAAEINPHALYRIERGESFPMATVAKLFHFLGYEAVTLTIEVDEHVNA